MVKYFGKLALIVGLSTLSVVIWPFCPPLSVVVMLVYVGLCNEDLPG